MRRRAAIALAALGGVALAAATLTLILRHQGRLDSIRSGTSLYESEDYRGAHRLALGHLKRWPDDRPALLLAARSLARMDRADRAESLFDRAGPPFDIEDLHARADGLLSAGRPGEAVTIYQELIDPEPEDVLALRRLAALEISRDNVPEASRLADRLIEIDEGRVIGLSLKGVIAYNGGTFETTASSLSQVLQLDPKLEQMPLNPRQMFWGYLANSLLNLGQASEARRHLERALREHPKDADFMDLMARCYEREGDLDRASHCWRQASEWNPKASSPWLNLGKLALLEGDPAAAIEPLERASVLVPDAPEPYHSLSLAHRRLGQIDEAEHYRTLADRLKDPNAHASPRAPQ